MKEKVYLSSYRAGKLTAFYIHTAIILSESNDTCISIMSPNKEKAEEAIQNTLKWYERIKAKGKFELIEDEFSFNSEKK